VLSTKLTDAKFAALRVAVADARKRASTIAAGLGAHLGQVQKTSLGVYQITPRNSTEVSDYGHEATARVVVVRDHANPRTFFRRDLVRGGVRGTEQSPPNSDHCSDGRA
jgi:hypothetical protein